MATIAKKASATHPHHRRTRNPGRHENPPAKPAHAVKPEPENSK